MIAAFFALFLFPQSAPAPVVYRDNVQPARGVSIGYTVTVSDPVSHLYHVDIDIRGIRTESVEVAMPAWTPGEYVIRDYVRNVQGFRAQAGRAEAGGSQTDKGTWRIAKRPEDDVQISYQVYSRELTDEMGDLALPAATFMYVVNQKHVPVSVKYNLPSHWSVYTELEQREDRFFAPDYDVFADSPAFLGRVKLLEFRSSSGTPHRLAISQPSLAMSDPQVSDDLKAIADAAVAMFGPTPYSQYTFFIKLQSVPGTPGAGNLAHLNSGRILVGETEFVNQTNYDRFLLTAAQTLTRAWNGKRIRPKLMGPFDYGRETYTRLLWMTEGVSDYLADLLLVRAGVSSPDDFYGRFSAIANAIQHAPGRSLMSLEDASWNTWTRGGDNSANNSISYRAKGEIAGLLLDLEIRTRTENRRNLDDVMRYLLATYANEGIGIPEDGFLKAVELTAGGSFAEFFDANIRGRGELDYNRYLRSAGLRMESFRQPAASYVGLEVERSENNQARVRRVIPGSPADRARFDVGDIMVAMNNERVTVENFATRFRSQRMGEKIVLTILRGERLLSIVVEPVEFQETDWSVIELSGSTPQQAAFRNTWLGRK